ncbi:MAG TPA: LysR substrate-binding domain-containing protein [Anaeromyxobacteraceae bacterium]|nr:LysR substrate-binding domain-containing protein [Anaeromyxobacteraceae bacterium]
MASSTLTERDPSLTGAPAPLAAPAVELRGAGRAFGAFRALEEVALAVHPGERVAILGPSGAGKSTLLRLANSSLAATAGEVRILGHDPQRLAPRALRALRARIGSIYQQLHLVPQASALENVLMGRLGRRSAIGTAVAALRRADREEVRDVLARVGIAHKLDERVDRLSGGEQQRVAVARVLYQAPDVVVADEPFSSVDPERSAAVLALLVEAARGRTLLLSTHQLEPVLPHFPRLVGLRAGRVVFDRPREQVTSADLALLYQPEEATRSQEPRRVLVPGRPEPRPGREGSELRIGASTTPGDHLLPAAVAAFARAEPGVQLRLSVASTADTLRGLREGRFDLAFVGARPHLDGLHFEDWADDEIVLVAPADFGGLPVPLHASLVARLPRVDREPGSATRAVVEAQLASLGAPLDPSAAVVEVGSVGALAAAVARGLGVGFASRRAVRAALRDGRLQEVPIDGVRVLRGFFAAWREGMEPSAAARRFLWLARRAAGSGE